MAHTLKIIKVTPADVESDVVDLGTILSGYVPKSLSLAKVLGNPNAALTETAYYICDKASIALIETEINDIEWAFAQARNHQKTGAGNRYYVKFQADGSGSIWRSEILDGKVTFNRNTLDYEWIAKQLTVGVIWTRRAWWEDNSEDELELSNVNGSGNGGIQVDNHDDGTHENFLDIASDQVDGVLPAPCRISMKNDTGGTQSYYNIYVGLSTYSATAFEHIIEGEDGTGFTSTPASGSASGGSVGRKAMSSSWGVLYWTLTGTQMEYAGGRYFRLLMRTDGDPPENTYIRTSIVGMWESDTILLDYGVTADYEIHDLGVVQIPPGLAGVTDISSLALRIEVKNASAGDIDIDFFQLTPLDSYLHLNSSIGTGLTSNHIIVDDGIKNIAYEEDTSGDKMSRYVRYGDHVSLWPGVAQRIIFLSSESDGASVIATTMNVSVHYRPRMLTI